MQQRFLKAFYLTSRKASLCFLSRVILPRPKKKLPLRFDRLLVVAPPRIGDAALALPVFAALRTTLPGSQIHVAANKYVSELLCLVREIDQVVPVSENLKNQLSDLRRILMRSGYDIGLDLNFDYPLFPAMIAGLSAPFSIGYEYAGRGYFLSKSLSPVGPAQHASDIFFQPILEISPSAEKANPRLNIPHEITTATQRMLLQAGIHEKDRLILIHPGAHYLTQRWFPEYFAKTAGRIIDAGWAKVVFAGGKEEKELIEKIQMKMTEQPHGAFTDLTLRGLIALIQRAQLMICNNSGPLHIAVAVNTPTVSTMGPTVRERWKPTGNIHKALRVDNLPCIGCNLGYCRIITHDCMAMIKPSMVLAAAQDLLEIHEGVQP